MSELNELAAKYLGRAHGGRRTACPICAKAGRDDAVSVTVNDDGSVVAHCHRCGESGTARPKANGARRPAARVRAARPAEDFTALWESGVEPGEACEHAYLQRKQVQAHGIRVVDELLLIPMRNAAGELIGVQKIAPDKRFMGGTKDKLYVRGSHKFGAQHLIGGGPGSRIIIAEGYATAATLYEATGIATVVAFDCGNLAPVARAIKVKYPSTTIVIAADDDVDTAGNPGLTNATDAARAVGGLLAVPDFGADRPEGVSDFNDLTAHRGREAVERAIRDASAPEPPLAQPEPESAAEGETGAQGWQDAPPRNESGADAAAQEPDADNAPESNPRPPDEPQNLFDTQAPSALDLRAALPSVLADFAAVRAGVAGHDPTAYAYAAIGAASGVIAHRTRIEITPTWREPLLQWVAEVGPTGSGKTPAMNAAVEPVIALHLSVQEKYKRDLAAWKTARDEGEEPARSGYYFTDPSIEALIDRAANASHTILRHADEGTAWLNAMGRYSTRGDSGERGIWLAAWNGSAYTVTRIERGDKSLDAWGVAVLYGITPAKLKEAYADASSDGMLARTLICLTDAARWIPTQPDLNAVAVTKRYARAVHVAAQAECTLTLSAGAADRWHALRTDYRATAQAVAEIAPGLAGFLVKAPTMAARLAGLFALLEGAAVVSDGSMERAEHFIRHAAATARIAHEQVFAVSQPVAIARRLAARILTSAGYRITRREFMRTDAFAKATEAERGVAIEHLAASGWLIEADGKRVRLGPRFREATGWRVNPLVHERFAAIAETERHAARDALARMNRLFGDAA